MIWKAENILPCEDTINFTMCSDRAKAIVAQLKLESKANIYDLIAVDDMIFTLNEMIEKLGID